MYKVHLEPHPIYPNLTTVQAYLKSFSLALGSELRPLGVGVTCAMPGATLGTNFGIRGNCSDAICFKLPGALDCDEVARMSVNAMLMGDSEVIRQAPLPIFFTLDFLNGKQCETNLIVINVIRW